MAKITSSTVRADFNDLQAVVHYTRAAHDLGLWASERQMIERFFPDRDAPLLEAGCGAGRVTLGLWELGYRRLTAFDFAEELLDQARSLALERGAGAITWLHADATDLRGARERKPEAGDPAPASPSPGAGWCHVSRDGPPPRQDEKSGQCHARRDTAAVTPGRRPRVRAVPAAASAAPASRGDHVLREESFGGALFLFNGLMQIPGRENRRAALRELHRVCVPGAPLLITTHDRDSSAEERALWRLETRRWVRGRQDPRLVEFGDRYFTDEAGRTFMHLPDRREVLEDLAATGWEHAFDSLRRELCRERRAVRDFSDECRFWAAHRRAT